MRSVEVTRKAESDLIDIWLYTFETWGAAQADRYVDQLGAAMDYLAQHPSMGVDYGHVLPDYRKFRIAHHDIFYRLLDTKILVVRVLHEDIDAPRRLM